MEHIDRITIEQCCLHYEIESAFIQELDEFGLIQITHIDSEAFLNDDQIPALERFIRMHYDLDINLQGIEAIEHLLIQIQDLKTEVLRLHNLVH